MADTFSPFVTLIRKRQAQFSTVAFLKTMDPKRLQMFLEFMFDYLSKKGTESYKVYLYKVWSGLFEVKRAQSGFTLVPVVAQTGGGSPLLQALGPGQVKDLSQATAFLDSAMQKGQRIIAIFWGLFSYRQVSEAEYYAFVKFLRNTIFSDEYYVSNHLVVVFTETPELIADDDTLKNSIVIDVPPSTEEERASMLKAIAEKFGVHVNGEELETLVKATKGLNLHELESVAIESIFEKGTLDVEALARYKNELVRKQGVLDVEEPTHGFEAVGGYDTLKEFIRVNVVKVLRNPAKAEKLGLRPPRGILLFGPPGTGKTHFARALAKELGLPFLRLRTERIVSMWYGQTSQNIAKALQTAEAVAPAVLFIDEVDRFGKRGGITEHEESRRAFSILLEWLGDEERKTIVVATSNLPQDLDDAFRRVGRFDYIIPMLYPNVKAREEILRIHTSVVRRVPLDGVDLVEVAEATEYWTGAELEELVLRAARRALREDADTVTMDHFRAALATFKVNAQQRQNQLQEYLRLAEEFTNDEEFLEEIRGEYPMASRAEAVGKF